MSDERDALERVLAYVGTCRRENTYEWMVGLIDVLNAAAPHVDSSAYFALRGHDVVLHHEPREHSS